MFGSLKLTGNKPSCEQAVIWMLSRSHSSEFIWIIKPLQSKLGVHWMEEIDPFSEMVEWKSDQAFPVLLDLSLSLTKALVTADAITLQDSPPYFW